MALNLSRIFKGKTSDSVVTDNVDPDELGVASVDGKFGPETEPAVIGLDVWEHASSVPGGTAAPNVLGDDMTDAVEGMNIASTTRHLESENGGLDTTPEEPEFDEADALFGKGNPNAQYNPKEIDVDKNTLPEVGDEVLVQFSKNPNPPSGIHDIHMNQGNSFGPTEPPAANAVEYGLITAARGGEAQDGSGTDNANRTMGPEGSGDEKGGSLLSQLDAGRREGPGWFVPDMDSDQSGMASEPPAGWITGVEFPEVKSEQAAGIIQDYYAHSNATSQDEAGTLKASFMAEDGDPMIGSIRETPLDGPEVSQNYAIEIDGISAGPRGLRDMEIQMATSNGGPESGDSGGPLFRSSQAEPALGGPDTPDRFVLDLEGEMAGHLRTAGPGGQASIGETENDATSGIMFDNFVDEAEVVDSGAGQFPAGYIGETEKGVIRDGKLTDNEYLDFGIEVKAQEFQALPDLDASGNSIVDAADYTVWRDNLRASNPPEGILPFIEQNNLVGGERFTASEEQIKTLIENLREKGLIDHSTGEIVWATGQESQANSISEANALVDWLRSTQPGVAPGDVVAMKFEISGGTGDADMLRSMGPGAEPAGMASEDGFVAPGDVAGMKFRFQRLPGDTDVVASPDSGETARSMGPDAQGFFRPNPAGDGTTEHFFRPNPAGDGTTEHFFRPNPTGDGTTEQFKSASGLEVETEVVDYREGGVNDTTHRFAADDGPSTFLDNLGDSGSSEAQESMSLNFEEVRIVHADPNDTAAHDIDFDGLDSDVDVP